MLHVTFYVLHFVHHLLLQWFIASKLSMVVRSFRLLFSSYLHLTLTVFHQLIIPLRYLTIKFGISLFSPHSASSAPSPLQGPFLPPFPIWWFHQSLLFCLRAIFWLLWFHGWFGCCGGCFYIPTFCSRRMPMIAPILHPRLIHSSIDIIFTISSSLLAFNIIHH